jgi:uncharacterized protein
MYVTKEQINLATDRLVKIFHPQRIILLGSQARGMADAHSDVDLLVVASFHGQRRKLQVKMDRALRGNGIARDIILLTPEEFERDKNIPGTIARPAMIEGKVLYEQN